MNVCILKESLSIGGTERSAANISRYLSETNEVYFTLFDGKNRQYEHGGELIDFCCPTQKNILSKVRNVFVRRLKLKKLIKEKKIDILFQFTGISNPLTSMKIGNTVKIISARDFGGMMARHNEYKKALDSSDGMICNSRYIRDYFLSIYPQDKDKVFAVYNVIDGQEIMLQSQVVPEPEFLSFVENHRHTIVSVGRFCREKGFEYLIRAFAQARKEMNQLGLVLIGDGDYRVQYEKLLRDFHLEEHVYFTGFQKNPYKYMTHCTCFALSSLSEGFPNVLAEAMSLGLPVIADNCYSGPAEILREDGDYHAALKDRFTLCDYGVLTPKIEDGENQAAVSELAGAMVKVLSNPEILDHYAKCAKLRSADFSGENAGQSLNSIFKTLMRRRSK